MWAVLLFFAIGSDEILAELNRLRVDPPAYAEKIAGRRQFFRGNVLRLPGRTPLRTMEGVRAVEEAVRVLRGARPLPPVRSSSALARAARDHAADIGASGRVTHDGGDGSSPLERVRRYDRDIRAAGEVITFGPDDAASVVIDLVVDDGVRGRGHRRLLLDGRFGYAGAACGRHAVYRTVCVIDLAE